MSVCACETMVAATHGTAVSASFFCLARSGMTGGYPASRSSINSCSSTSASHAGCSGWASTTAAAWFCMRMRGAVALADRDRGGEAIRMRRRRSCPEVQPGAPAFAGYRFPSEVILLAVRWYLRFGLSYRDLEELLAERGIEVDHVTLYRWV